MAERRMLAKSIVTSDAFLDMPAEAQALYLQLNMAADDDGFVDSPRSIMRTCGASNDTMKILIAKKFVLTFEKGDNFLVVVKHWKVNNYIRKDTYRETRYKALMRELYLDENGSYSLNPGDGHIPLIENRDEPVTTPSQVRDGPETSFSIPASTQDRIGKVIDSIDQDSIDQSINDEPAAQAGADIDPYNQKIISFVKNGMYDAAAGLYRLYTAQGLDVIHPGDVKT